MKIKDSFLVTFLLTGAVLITADDDKDDDDDGQPNYCPEDNGMFPNPNDCTSFYNCVDGTAILQTCAPGLLFDPKKKMCNFPNQVKCSNMCRSPNGLFPSQHRCDEFVLCTNNKPEVKKCKKGLYFDPNLQVCNYKDQVLCNLPGGGKKENKTEGNKDTKSRVQAESKKGHRELAAASVRSVCPKARGLFAHADSCNMFYQCYDGEVLMKKCPAGLLFDEYRHMCAYGKEVDCGDRRVSRHPNDP